MEGKPKGGIYTQYITRKGNKLLVLYRHQAKTLLVVGKVATPLLEKHL